MSIFLTLLRRELAAFFYSVNGYLIIAAVTLLIGESFSTVITNLGSDASPMPVTELFYSTYYFWMIVLLAAPVMTMRLFALEKASGTFETLMTTQIGDVAVVAAKFCAAMIFYLVAWLPLLLCLFIVGHYARQHLGLDAGTLGGMFLGIFLIGCLFISLGCFASAITSSQMAAAMVSFVLGMSLFSLAFLAKALPPNSDLTQIIPYFDLFDQMDSFARGVVDTRVVVFYVSASFFFLFLTLRVVESRRWK
jgi:ABC-2 type transport system permease protein